MKVWHSQNGGPWRQIDPKPRSTVGFIADQLDPGEVYDDGFGNRYRTDEPDQPQEPAP